MCAGLAVLGTPGADIGGDAGGAGIAGGATYAFCCAVVGGGGAGAVGGGGASGSATGPAFESGDPRTRTGCTRLYPRRDRGC